MNALRHPISSIENFTLVAPNKHIISQKKIMVKLQQPVIFYIISLEYLGYKWNATRTVSS